MKPFTIVLFVILLAIGFALLLPVKTISSTTTSTTTSCGQFPIDEPQYEWPTQTRVALYVPSADMGSNVLNA